MMMSLDATDPIALSIVMSKETQTAELSGLVKRQSFKRWYDHDPVLMRLMRVLYHYEVEVTPYVKLFLSKVEDQVGKEVLQAFYDEVEQSTPRGRRWYDDDPAMFKLIELFRLMPSDVQRRAADAFLAILKQYGVDPF
ncbi:MAG: hypothetical protein ACKO37_09475 [Vampirovibrionales bacterium]